MPIVTAAAAKQNDQHYDQDDQSHVALLYKSAAQPPRHHCHAHDFLGALPHTPHAGKTSKNTVRRGALIARSSLSPSYAVLRPNRRPITKLTPAAMPMAAKG